MGILRKAAGWALGWLAALAGWFTCCRADAKRVLILEPFGMGDVISLEPMVRALRQNGMEVTICAQSRWRQLYDDSVDWLDVDVPWATYQDKAKYALGGYLGGRFREFRRRLRSVAKGAIGIDPRGDVRSILLLRLAGCSRVVTLSCYLGSDMVVPPDCAERAYFDSSVPRWRNNVLLAEKVLEKTLSLSPPAIGHLPKARSSKRRIGVVAVAPWAGKLWPSARWKELRQNLEADGFSVVALHGPGQMAVTREAIGAAADLRECRSIAEWSDSLASLHALVSVDTGPMHLGAALGLRVVGLFGQGLLPLWGPAGEQCVALHHQDEEGFQPCHPIEKNAPEGARWMEKITVEEVMQALRR